MSYGEGNPFRTRTVGWPGLVVVGARHGAEEGGTRRFVARSNA